MNPRTEGVAIARSSLALVALAWVLPFHWTYRPLPIGSFYSEALAIALGLAALAALLTQPRSSGDGFPMPAAALGLVALAALILVQDVLGLAPYSGNARTAARYLAWAAMLSMLGARLCRDLGRDATAAALAWSLFAGGVIGAVISAIQLFQLDTPLGYFIALPGREGSYGNLGQPGHFANYMALATLSAGYLHARGSLHGAAAFPAFAAFLFVLALTGRRATWLYLALIVVLAWLPWRSLGGAAASRLRRFGLFIVPAFVLAQLMLGALPPATREPVVAVGRLVEVGSGIDIRLWLAQSGLRAFAVSPLIGVGWGQYGLHHFEALADWGVLAGVGTVTRHVHNLFLQLLAETGIVGAGVIVAAAAVWLLDLRRRSFDLATWWVLGLLGILVLHSLLENPLWYAYFLGIAAVLVGLGAGRTMAIERHAGVFVTICAMAYGAYVLVHSLQNYRGFEKALYAARALPEAERAALMNRLLERNRDDPHLAPYVEVFVSREMAISDRLLEEKLALNSRLMRFAPVSHVAYRQAMLLALAGDRSGAERQFRRAAAVYPDRLPQAVSELERLAKQYPGRTGFLLRMARAERKSTVRPAGAR